MNKKITADVETLRFAGGFVGGIIEGIEAPQPKSSTILS